MINFFKKKKVKEKPIKMIAGYELVGRSEFDYNLIQYGIVPYKSISTFKQNFTEDLMSVINIRESGIIHAVFHKDIPIHRITYKYCAGLDFLELMINVKKTIDYYLKEKDLPFEAIKEYASKRIKNEYANSDYMITKGDFLILKDEYRNGVYNVYDSDGEHSKDLKIFKESAFRIDTFQNINKDILKISEDIYKKIKINDFKNEINICDYNYKYNRTCLEIDIENKESLYIIDGIFAFGKEKRNMYYKEKPLIMFKNKLNKDFEKLSVEEIIDDKDFEIVYISEGRYLRASEFRDFLIDKRKSEDDIKDFKKRYKGLRKAIVKEIESIVEVN